MQKAVFLDKDGTLIENVDYNVNTERITLLSGVVPTLKELKAEGYLLIVITNQSGVAQGMFEESAIKNVGNYLKRLLSLWHVRLDGFYYCPHYVDGVVKEYATDCDCRKPKPGLLMQAAFDFDIDLRNSWMIGDLITDVEAGKRAGCRTILFNKDKEFEFVLEDSPMPDATANQWNQIGDIILRKEDEAYVQLL